jgi:hypothetical protein
MGYRILPGLYAVGKPGADSHVFVTANYKLSFDNLRKNLDSMDAWILVLDTKGVNVWCAAGKGTFGTEEIVRRVKSINLASIVRHGTLILPQLGASGVAAHIVTKQTGFRVIYGPIRAHDIPEFIRNGFKADQKMRTVTFTLKERLAVTPIELVQSWKIVLGALVLHIISRLLAGNLFDRSAIVSFLPFLGVILLGGFVVPILLPFIPGRPFVWKGWLLGFIVTMVFIVAFPLMPIVCLAYLLLLPPISAYLALNFTGASTCTSLSGVRKEIIYAMPCLIFSAVAGIILYLIDAWRMS